MQQVPLTPPEILYERPPVVDDGQLETDCACSASPFQSHAPSVRWPNIQNLRVSRAEAISYAVDSDHSTLFSNTGQIAVVNSTSEHIWHSFDHPTSIKGVVADQRTGLPADMVTDAALTLYNLGFLTDDPDRAVRLSYPEVLTAWLHTTNDCNLSCTYCYLAKSREVMNEATGRAAVDAVFRSAVHHGFKAVKLKYAGGEATLNFGLVRTLHAYAKTLSTEHELELREVVLSNGVALTTTILDFIQESGLRLMISLDGLGVAHDAQRVFVNGHGSSRHVVHSVDRALEHGIKPHLSITVTRHNAANVAEAVVFALDRDLLFNLNFYRDTARITNRDEMMAEDEQLIAGAQAAFAVIEQRLPRQSLIAGLVDRSSFNGLHDHACGAGQSYLVIDHNGRITHCQMEIEHPVTDVMAEDPLALIQAVQPGFSNVSVDHKQGCRDCKWRYWCAGGCPLLTYRVTGRNDVKSPYCNVYRALFPDLLRLEGLRLLKWSSKLM